MPFQKSTSKAFKSKLPPTNLPDAAKTKARDSQPLGFRASIEKYSRSMQVYTQQQLSTTTIFGSRNDELTAIYCHEAGCYHPSETPATSTYHCPPKLSTFNPLIAVTELPLSQHQSARSPSLLFTPKSAWHNHHSRLPLVTIPSQRNHNPYICRICRKAFSRPSTLRTHSNSHTGEKPFRCPNTYCGKAFSARSNMKRHERNCHFDRLVPTTALVT
jgi:Zinc finger, C2H2 type.